MIEAIAVEAIRPAIVEDASFILDLIQQGFGSAYLPYTLYQAPQSVTYVRELIEMGFERSNHALYCLTQNTVVAGFYDAVQRDTEFFLNYIVIASAVQSRGLGQALLNHYEVLGYRLGCTQLTLDVFESNRRAHAWYTTHGYQFQTESWLMQLAVDQSTEELGPAFDCDEAILNRALIEESVRGFSKIEGACESGLLTVGLIAGHTCKLLNYIGLSQTRAAMSICRKFRGQRRLLIVPSAVVPLNAGPMLSTEKVLRLSKIIQ